MLEVMTGWKDEGSGTERSDEEPSWLMSLEVGCWHSESGREIFPNPVDFTLPGGESKFRNPYSTRRFGRVTSINASLRWY